MEIDWKDHILEWLDASLATAEKQAASRGGTRYKLTALKRAISSIRAHEAPVTDPASLSDLAGVGDKTVAILLAKTKQHCAKHPEIASPPSLLAQTTAEPRVPALATKRDNQSYPFAPPPPPKRRQYVPRYGSAAYHILVAMRLWECEERGGGVGAVGHGIGQGELQRLLKQRSGAVLEGALGRSTPSIGAALKTLRDNDCIFLKNSRYFLDDPGRELANGLMHIEGTRPQSAVSETSSPSALSRVPKPAADSAEQNGFVDEEWAPGSFSVKLLIDNREVASKHDRTGLVNDLRSLGLDIDVVALSVGDALWVAEHRSGRRAVLDYIVERKTLSDLRSSIHDGRYGEQKRRLARSTLGQIIYLVEFANTVSNNELFKDSKKKFMTAMSQTLVRHHFHLKLTRSQNDTVQYLARLTRLIAQRTESRPLVVAVPNVETFEASMTAARARFGRFVAIDYSAFHEGLAKSKQRTIGDTWRIMLRTIKGISAEKAMAIQRAYPTPAHLMEAYDAEPDEQARRDLVHRDTLGCIKRQQIRGPLSAQIYEVWGP